MDKHPHAMLSWEEDKNFITPNVEPMFNQSVSLSEESVCNAVEERKVSLAEIIACTISVLTIIENLAILIAIIKGPRSLRKPPYWFIASLAAADLLTGIEVIVAISVKVGTSPQSRIVLKGLAVVTFIVSINSLLLVSFDRYLRITRHVDYERLLTRKRIVSLIAASWLLSIGMFLVAPLLGLWSCAAQHCCADDGLCVCRRSHFGEAACNTECSQSFVPFSKLYLMVGTGYFLISILFMVFFYIALFRAVRKKTFGHSRGSSKGDHSKPKKREVQLAKTLIITLGIFVVCWLPVVALFLADIIITRPTKELSKIFDYALVPSVVNSFLNPIIYSIRLPRMRATVKHLMLPCIYRRNENGYFGSAWTTNTSLDLSSRRRSVLKRLEKLKGTTRANNSGSGKSNNSSYARSRVASDGSFNGLSTAVNAKE